MQTLSPTSKLLLRSLPRLLEYKQALVLVNPPADSLIRELFSEGISNLSIWSHDYHIYQYIKNDTKELTLDIDFTANIQISGNQKPGMAIIFLPREKPFLDYLVAQTLGALRPGATVWLVGENRAGIRSSAKRLANLSGTAVTKLDSARHCSLLETTIRTDHQDTEHVLAETQSGFELEFNQQSWEFTTLPGVFSCGRMDPASQMLLHSLEKQAVRGKVLDFACGCGVLGICASSLQPGISLDLLDVSAMALTSTELNIHQAALPPGKVNIFASDAYSAVRDRYDAIISNPPFHRHTRQTLEVSERLILQAPLHLKPRGELRIVANRHLPYLKLFQQTFRKVEILNSDRNFHVILGKYPFTHRT
ncbi:MAG: class I SAM-dependent methyltransferase [Proteobacteria bacterium]|nr:class I SAM-dependent methyltransferase [Pseudomonadota bacterium]